MSRYPGGSLTSATTDIYPRPTNRRSLPVQRQAIHETDIDNDHSLGIKNDDDDDEYSAQSSRSTSSSSAASSSIDWSPHNHQSTHRSTRSVVTKEQQWQQQRLLDSANKSLAESAAAAKINRARSLINCRPPFQILFSEKPVIQAKHTLRSELLPWTKKQRVFDGSGNLTMCYMTNSEREAESQAKKQHMMMMGGGGKLPNMVTAETTTTRAVTANGLGGSYQLQLQRQHEQQQRPSTTGNDVPARTRFQSIEAIRFTGGAMTGAKQTSANEDNNKSNVNTSTSHNLFASSTSYAARPSAHIYTNSFFEFFGTLSPSGIPNGPGRLLLRDGTTLEGVFKHGELTGKGGVKTTPNGAVYSGEFLLGEPHGQGLFISPDGVRYEGGFAGGFFDGFGSLVQKGSKEFISYKGNFERHQFHGRGTLEQYSLLSPKNNGEQQSQTKLFTLSGNFHRGKPHGPCEIEFASNGDIVTANFDHGATSSDNSAATFVSAATSITYKGEMIERVNNDNSTSGGAGGVADQRRWSRRWIPTSLDIADIAVDGETMLAWYHPGLQALVRQRIEGKAQAEKQQQQREKDEQQQQQQQKQRGSPTTQHAGPSSSSPKIVVVSPPSSPESARSNTKSETAFAAHDPTEVSYLELMSFPFCGVSSVTSQPSKKPRDFLDWIAKHVKLQPAALLLSARGGGAAPLAAPGKKGGTSNALQQQQQQSLLLSSSICSQVPQEVKAIWCKPLSRVSIALRLVCPDEQQRDVRRKLLIEQQKTLAARQQQIARPLSSGSSTSLSARQRQQQQQELELLDAEPVDNRTVLETGRKFALRVFALPPQDSSEWQSLLEQHQAEIKAALQAQQEQQQQQTLTSIAVAGIVNDILLSKIPLDGPLDLLDLAASATPPRDTKEDDAALLKQSLAAFEQEEAAKSLSRRISFRAGASTSARSAVAGGAASSSARSSSTASPLHSALSSSRRPVSAKQVRFAGDQSQRDAEQKSEQQSPEQPQQEQQQQPEQLAWNKTRFKVASSITRTAIDGQFAFDFIVLRGGKTNSKDEDKVQHQQQFVVEITPMQPLVQVVAGEPNSVVRPSLAGRLRLRMLK